MKIEAAAQGDGNLRATTTHEVRVRRAQLAVKVTAPPMLYAGATATYEIRVANTGDAAAEGVTLELQLPGRATRTRWAWTRNRSRTRHARWRLGDLPPGSDRVYTMQCDLITGGQQPVRSPHPGHGRQPGLRHGSHHRRSAGRPEAHRQRSEGTAAGRQGSARTKSRCSTAARKKPPTSI